MTDHTRPGVGAPTLLFLILLVAAFAWDGFPTQFPDEASAALPEPLLTGVAIPAAPEQEMAQTGQELPEGVTREMIEAGREIFGGVGTCLTCHGEEGVGTPIGPALAGGEWIHIEGSYAEIVQIVTSGVMEPEQFPMPMLPRAGTDLDDEQIASVAAYVWLISRDR